MIKESERKSAQWIDYGTKIVLLAVTYDLVGKLGLLLAQGHPGTTPVWPPSGISVAALLIFGYRVWPGVFVGALAFGLATPCSVTLALGVAAGNTLESLAGAWLATRFARGRWFFERPADVLKFTVLVGILSPLLSPPLGTTSTSLHNGFFWLGGGSDWLACWLGDLVSLVVLTPLLVIWSVKPRISQSRWQVFEFALLLGLLIVVGEAVFGQLAPVSAQGYLLPYLCLPFLIWAAFRFGPRGTTLVVFVLGVMVLWGTMRGYGLFARSMPEAALLANQGFIAFNSVMALAVAAVVAQRRKGVEELQRAHDELELRVHRRTADLEAEVAERKKKEEELQRSEDRFKVIASSTPDHLLVQDRELRYVFVVNPQLGLTEQDMVGKTDYDFLTREDADKLGQIKKRVLETGEVARLEVPLVSRKGEQEFFDGAYIPKYDARGEVDGLIGYFRNVTERKQIQEALRRANQELEDRVAERTAELRGAFHYARGLLEASLDPLVTISPEGNITDVNQATELVTGVPREQLIGSKFTNHFTQPDKAEAGYQRVLAEGLVRDYPLTIRHVSGRFTEVLYNATVYRDESGQVQGVFAAARDITERKAAEERRAVTHALLELFAHKASGKEYFESVVEVIRTWTGCQCLGIRVAEQNGEIPYSAAAGFDVDFLQLESRLSIGKHNCFCMRAISQKAEAQDRALLTPGGSVRCDDAPGFMRQLVPDQRNHYRGTCVKWGFASIAVIPIRYRAEILGAIHLADRRPGRFPAGVVEFLESMTPLIGEAIQRFRAEAELSRYRDHLEELVKQRTAELEAANAQLQAAEANLQRERDQLEIRVQERTADLSKVNQALQAEILQRQRAEQEHQTLLRRLAEAQESERGRISRELHDQLGQELTALKLGLRLVKNQALALPAGGQGISQLEQLVDSLMQEIHRLAWELHPAALDDLGLETALRRYTAAWSEKNRVPVNFHSHGLEAERLPLELETALYRVTQEALNNISKHAQAQNVGVMLHRYPDRISLVVEDDGAGFEAADVFQASGSRGRLGLLGMKERVTLAGGTIEIESSSNAGTTVIVRIPLVGEAPAGGHHP